MSRIDLHPEDLIDREADGELSARDEQHLEEHRTHCVACVLEEELRADFATGSFRHNERGERAVRSHWCESRWPRQSFSSRQAPPERSGRSTSLCPTSRSKHLLLPRTMNRSSRTSSAIETFLGADEGSRAIPRPPIQRRRWKIHDRHLRKYRTSPRPRRHRTPQGSSSRDRRTFRLRSPDRKPGRRRPSATLPRSSAGPTRRAAKVASKRRRGSIESSPEIIGVRVRRSPPGSLSVGSFWTESVIHAVRYSSSIVTSPCLRRVTWLKKRGWGELSV